MRDGDTQRVLEAPLDKLEDALTRLNAVALDTGIDGWRDKHRASTDLANEAHSEATILIHRSTVHIASRLDAKWKALNVLAVLAITTTVLLLLRVRHERRMDGRERRSVRELRESDKRFRAMLAALPDVVMVLDASGRYRNVYTADEDLLADTPEALVGKTIHEVLPKKAARSIQTVIDRAIATGEVQQYEYPLETAGEQRWFAARVVEFGSSDDPCVIWVARELTARKRAEGAQRDSEARFRQLAENLDQVI
ncbi:MAG: PAS domain-containing protein, partial [Gemmatimonadales bacterium]